MFARGLAGITPLLAVVIVTCAPPPPLPAPPASISIPIAPPRAEAPVPEAQAEAAPPPAPPRRNAADLRAEFGQPDFVRRETDSELWRYDGEGCALFALLYRAENDFLVRRIETLPAGNGTPADETCIASVKARAEQPS
jgi:hypothetical protein